jgi:hypothetical protein
MKNLLKTEELFMFLLGLYLFSLLNYPWWLFAALFLAPDIGLLGYLFGVKTGAITYNLTHHKGLAIAFYLAGLYFTSPALMLCGMVMFAHSSFDRILGYGLKYPGNFKETHLGTIGIS